MHAPLSSVDDFSVSVGENATVDSTPKGAYRQSRRIATQFEFEKRSSGQAGLKCMPRMSSVRGPKDADISGDIEYVGVDAVYDDATDRSIRQACVWQVAANIDPVGTICSEHKEVTCAIGICDSRIEITNSGNPAP